jgi:hypothetical protein
MSRQHFQFLADVLKDSRPYDDTEEAAYWDRLVDRFADALHATNPRFDCDRFIRACGKVTL